MAVVEEIIRVETDGTISFGNHTLDVKTKVADFEFAGCYFGSFKRSTKADT